MAGRGTEDWFPLPTHSLTRVWICCCSVCWVASRSSCGGAGNRNGQGRVRPQRALLPTTSPSCAPPYRVAVQFVVKALGEFVQTLLGTERQRQSTRRGPAGCLHPACQGCLRPQPQPYSGLAPRHPRPSLPLQRISALQTPAGSTYRHHGLWGTQAGQVTNARDEGTASGKVMAPTFQKAIPQLEELRSNGVKGELCHVPPYWAPLLSLWQEGRFLSLRLGSHRSVPS